MVAMTNPTRARRTPLGRITRAPTRMASTAPRLRVATRTENHHTAGSAHEGTTRRVTSRRAITNGRTMTSPTARSAPFLKNSGAPEPGHVGNAGSTKARPAIAASATTMYGRARVDTRSIAVRIVVAPATRSYPRSSEYPAKAKAA